jgi:ubiquinone/menaquinone biosynthesis C-methylase UbiE
VSDATDDPVASGYDAFYAAWGTSETLRSLWRDDVTGRDFPDEYAHISFLRLADLRALVAGLDLDAGRHLVDLACGAGGPGLWAAATTGARLTGVDLSSVAVQVAASRAAGLGLGDRAEFRRGSFESTGLDDAAADAVMTIDALQYAPDKRAALGEMARILRPGGMLGIVTFELDAAHVAGLGVWDDAVADHRPLLDDAGFDVIEHRELDGWREAVTTAFTHVLERQDALVAELGEAAATALALEAATTLQVEPYCGHAFVLARRR